MFRTVKFTVFSALLLIAARNAASQSKYQVVSVSNAGTITGSVQWAGPAPRALTFPITKDPAVCDPESRKKVDLERLIVGPQGGVANTVVFLKYISSGKASHGHPRDQTPPGPKALSLRASYNVSAREWPSSDEEF